MKNLLKTISIILIVFSTITLLKAQCSFSDEGDNSLPPNNISPYSSYNGYYLPAHGTLRILVVFAEIDYNVTTDPDTQNDQWVAHSLPDWANDLLDPYTPTGTANGLLTQYYQEASYGQYNVIGDYLLSSNNGGIFKILESDISNNNYLDLLCNEINATMNGNLITAHALNDVSYFDNWTITEFGQPNITPSQDSPHIIDHVMIIWRNRLNGVGVGSYGFPYTIVGFLVSSSSQQGSFDKMPLAVCRHEYGHMIYGTNRFHAGGGGHRKNYFIPRAGGWSNMGLSGSSLQTWNAWDRQRLGWKPTANQYNPSARNGNNTNEVNGDLDATISSDAGIYFLRDFVTTGDAIRIKLPFIDPDTEFPEFLWIENHSGTNINNSPFDRWQYQADCIDPLIPGLMMYLQIDREIRTSAEIGDVFGGFEGYIRPLTADGYFDRTYGETTVQNECIDWGMQHPFTESFSNPLTGDGDQGHYVYDANNDEAIKIEDEQLNFIEYKNGQYFKNLFELGNTSHVFTLEGNHKVDISTNPSSASMMNTVGKNSPVLYENNLRKVYLNGVSVTILEQDSIGIKIRVRFDDVDVEDNVRWCADTIILSPVQTLSGHSLNLKSGYTVSLEQTLTATRMKNPVMFEGNKIFASPTHFHCRPNTIFHMETGSKLILDDESTFLLQHGSKLDIEQGGYLDLKNESEIIIKNGAVMEIGNSSQITFEDNSKITVEEGGELIIHDNVTLTSMLNSSEISVYGSLLVGNDVGFIGQGEAELKINIYNTANDVVFNNSQFSNSGILAYINKMTISNSALSDAGIYGFNGDFEISNCNFHNSFANIKNADGNERYVNITGECNFSGYNLGDAIKIDNYPNFVISNNTISNCYSGIYILNSGYGREVNLISENTITNNSNVGVTIYRSTVDMFNNISNTNNIGLKLLDKCQSTIQGNDKSISQQFSENNQYQLYITKGSFPHVIRYNKIWDNDNTVCWVKYTGSEEGLDIRYNNWGGNYVPTNNLCPTGVYLIEPIWNPGDSDNGSGAEAMFNNASDLAQQENFTGAKAAYQQVITQYPDTKFAQAALKELVNLEKYAGNDYSSLKTYYETEPAVQNNPELVKLADFLANRCNIKLANWPDAISWFENVIQNPESIEDSIFAIIDLSYTYWLMENGGQKSSSYVGSMSQYKFTDYTTFEDNRDYLLSLLPGDDLNLSESMKQKVNALDDGELLQNVPNPFSGTTRIFYKLTNDAIVTVNIFDYTGKQIKTYKEGETSGGVHSVVFDAKGLTSGMYFYSIDVNGVRSDSKKMVVK